MSTYFKGEEVLFAHKLLELKWMDQGVPIDPHDPKPLGVTDLVCVKARNIPDVNILDQWVEHFQAKDAPYCVTQWCGEKMVGRYYASATWMTLWVEMKAAPVNR